MGTRGGGLWSGGTEEGPGGGEGEQEKTAGGMHEPIVFLVPN